MSNTPLQVSYSLEEVLARIEGKIDNYHQETNQKLEKIDERLTKLEVGQARLETDFVAVKEDIKDIKGSQRAQVWTLIGILGTALIGTVVRFLITALPGNP